MLVELPRRTRRTRRTQNLFTRELSLGPDQSGESGESGGQAAAIAAPSYATAAQRAPTIGAHAVINGHAHLGGYWGLPCVFGGALSRPTSAIAHFFAQRKCRNGRASCPS
jgi:hypothetical protein